MGPTVVEKISIQPELEDMPLLLLLHAKFENIALLVKGLPILISITGLKANRLTANATLWEPLRVS
jgi:hypothetical protein